MIYNPYRRLLGLLPKRPLLIGTVTEVSDGTATVALPGGAKIKARGEATVNDTVFVRDGQIEGQAPSLTVEVIEIGA